jgi:hypothetical protein
MMVTLQPALTPAVSLNLQRQDPDREQGRDREAQGLGPIALTLAFAKFVPDGAFVADVLGMPNMRWESQRLV